MMETIKSNTPDVSLKNNEKLIDIVLDKKNNLQAEINQLMTQVNHAQVEMSDSENKDEQIHFKNFIDDSIKNPIIQEILEKQREIQKLNLEFEKLSKNI